MSDHDFGSATRARFDRFNVDLSTGKLQRSGLNVPIQRQPLQLLRLLLMANGEVVSRDELRAALWSEDTFVDFEHSLNTAVRKLRQALEDSVDDPKFVETLPRLGYRFLVPVEWAPNESDRRVDEDVPSASSTPTATLFPPRRQELTAGLALLAILILAAATFLSYEGPLFFRLEGLLRGVEVCHPRPPIPTEPRLTANPEDTPVTSGVISPDGKYLAYTDSTGLYLEQVDSGDTHLVPLPAGFSLLAESWFPYNVHLVDSRAESPLSPAGLWEISILGGRPRRLAEVGSSASVSPSGTQIVFLRQALARTEIGLMQTDGISAKMLLSSEEDNFGQLAWAPDGNRIAYARTKTRYYAAQNGPDNLIEALDVKTGEITVVQRLRERGLPHGSAAMAWTPDGRLIYPRREPAPNQQDANLWWTKVEAETGLALGPPVRLTSGPGMAVQLSFGSDGRRIAVRRDAPHSDVYVGDLRQGGTSLVTLKRLTLDEREDLATSWTADSKAVLFYSNRDGPFHIFAQNIEATQPDRLVGGKDDLDLPRLSPDGTSVLYLIRAKPGGSSEKSQIMRIPLIGGPSQLVLEDTGIWDIECARGPSSLCLYSRIQGGKRTFFRFDSVKGLIGELQVAKSQSDNFDWCLSPDGRYLAWAKNRASLK